MIKIIIELNESTEGVLDINATAGRQDPTDLEIAAFEQIRRMFVTQPFGSRETKKREWLKD